MAMTTCDGFVAEVLKAALKNQTHSRVPSERQLLGHARLEHPGRIARTLIDRDQLDPSHRDDVFAIESESAWLT
jgi:hypothetical protein